VLVRDFAAAFEKLWPASGAEEWDRPGLSVGSLATPVTGVLFTVDVTSAVLDEALSLGANLVVSHHPLMLYGVTTVSEETSKGALVSQAIRGGLAIFSAHTNADIVEEGVSDVIAKSLGLSNILPLVPTGGSNGHGRIGDLAAPVTLEQVVNTLADLLPLTSRGVACSGHPSTLVQRIALCGGAGDSFIDAAISSGADVYITSDLRHHVTQEAKLPLIDVSHWASESLWLEKASRQLVSMYANEKITVSSVATDPWVFTAGRTK
jgi:dinuclear metal center YbgI/SA1388 family protein